MASKEQILLRAFLDSRSTFEKYAPYILAIKNLERNVKFMLDYIKKFYEKYNSATKIPESELRIYLDSNDLYNFASNNTEFIKTLYSIDMDNEDLTMDVIESACERHFIISIRV